MARKKVKHRSVIKSIFSLGFIVLTSFIIFLCWQWFDAIVSRFGLITTSLAVVVLVLTSATLFGFSYRKIIKKMGG